MQTLYALSSGEYSDYQVHALFATKELAEQAADMYARLDKWSKPFVETYQVFHEAPTPISVLTMTANLAPDGKVLHEHTWTNVVWPWDGDDYDTKPDAEVRVGQWAPRPSYQADTPHEKYLPVRAVGTNHEKVAKIFHDTVARIRADLEGLT